MSSSICHWQNTLAKAWLYVAEQMLTKASKSRAAAGSSGAAVRCRGCTSRTCPCGEWNGLCYQACRCAVNALEPAKLAGTTLYCACTTDQKRLFTCVLSKHRAWPISATHNQDTQAAHRHMQSTAAVSLMPLLAAAVVKSPWYTS